MNWKNTGLIFRRELIDQWRDRRTIFTILVMPVVLYPLMGMAMLQTAQFMQSEPPQILLVGEEHLPSSPDLLESRTEDGLANLQSEAPTFTVVREAGLETRWRERLPALLTQDDRESHPRLEQFMKQSDLDLILQAVPDSSSTSDAPPSLRLFVNSTSDQSAMAYGSVSQSIERWRMERLKKQLEKANLVSEKESQVHVEAIDISPRDYRQVVMWAKLLPFVVLVWALTGAFYPAIDVCAGEKERGTLETLLSSPARRVEVVMGKLLTVATFSFTTALLNLFSMTLTGLLVIGQLNGIAGGLNFNLGFPPVASLPWLVIGIIPLVALFSSLALALAAFAKSSKEGQYYLVPLLMSLVPLMMLSMLPTARLDLGTSLIPVTGMLLLQKNLIMGHYGTALQFAGPVLAITLVGCWMAMRWAVHQFNNESVLFRSGEKFGIGVWLRHLVRDRGPLPSFGEAVLCGVIILIVKFFVGLSADISPTFGGFALQMVVSQVATIALPAVLMALFLTRGPRITLKLRWPRISYVPTGILVAILLHPAFMAVSEWVMYLYPASPGLGHLQTAISTILADAPGTWAVLLIVAIVPAFCEEVAFRGFILSGLQTIRGNWTAIVISALFFGIAHGILQQSIIATFVGIVLGIVAVRTGSLLPCIAYHATHNALPVLMAEFPTHSIESSWTGYFLTVGQQGAIEYTLLASIMLPLAGIGILIWLWKFSDRMGTPYIYQPRRQTVAA